MKIPEDAKLCTGNAAVFIMPPQSVNQEETLKLMEWMSGEEFAQLYAEKCGIYMPTKNAALPQEASSALGKILSLISMKETLHHYHFCIIRRDLMQELHYRHILMGNPLRKMSEMHGMSCGKV